MPSSTSIRPVDTSWLACHGGKKLVNFGARRVADAGFDGYVLALGNYEVL